jgi:hypothetical protein
MQNNSKYTGGIKLFDLIITLIQVAWNNIIQSYFIYYYSFILNNFREHAVNNVKLFYISPLVYAQ